MTENESPQGGTPRTGTQSIERVVGMLRVVASRGRRGMRIGEVATTSGLPQSTCFRMLQRLEIEGLVDRDPHTRKYFLGPLLHELGLLARPRYRLSELCDAAVHRLADLTQDTVYLSERSGMEAVCTNRALGDYPIKAMPLDIGIRRPLGVGAGGLAMLCAMPVEEAEAIIDANGHRYEKFASFTADFLREAVARGRAQGYSFLDSVVTPGTAAIGVAFPTENPVGAISIAAISGRLESERREDLARELKQQVRKVEAAMNSAGGLSESSDNAKKT
ncbi:IclR family transcriptional regulator [Variovorax ginsengisoli]|uniref:DNA-binding IclR family transcriptional regulator n=1 Tax=Variovorax ginsengisoli TaxID=363844 RepID=A0ABT9S3T0_9BURK|nr:IclR family transcriptional regulator [Variovorax ginsengisoli]MDP9898895.1 DNA-binding IclR family transcriptional regulator [Variovorax ginsengisoli]